MKLVAAVVGFSLFATVAFAQEKDEVAAAAKKLTETKNYAFKGTSKTEGNLPFGGGGGGAGGIPEQKFQGVYDSATGLVVSNDANEWVKVGDITVTRPKAEWRVVEQPAAGGGGRGGRGGMGGMMGGMFGGAPKAPHEDLKDFGTKLAGAKKADAKETIGETECSVYSGDLTDEATKESLPFGRMMERFAADAEIKGTSKVWIDGEGNICKYETTVRVAASFQGNDFEISIVRTVSVFDAGKAKVEIPEGAKAAIEKRKKQGDY